MSTAAIVKLAPVLTAERYKNPEWERPGRDFYWSGSLALLPKREIPLLVVVAGAAAAAPRRRRMPPIAMDTRNRTRRH